YYITFTGNPRQFQFQDARVYYYVALVLMLTATGVVAWLERRRFGVYLSAIREDESACEALGVDTFRYKMLAMMLSSFLTGVGGAFYAFYLFSLQPGSVFGLTLAEGEVLGLIGPNGAGKTTAFNLLSGFLAPDAGEIRFRGRSLLGLKPHTICQLGLARTFQIVRPFPRLSVLDNVMVGALAR